MNKILFFIILNSFLISKISGQCCFNRCNLKRPCYFYVDCCRQCDPYTCNLNCPKAAAPKCEFDPSCNRYFCNCDY